MWLILQSSVALAVVGGVTRTMPRLIAGAGESTTVKTDMACWIGQAGYVCARAHVAQSLGLCRAWFTKSLMHICVAPLAWLGLARLGLA